MVRLGDYITQIRGVSYKPDDLSLTLDEEHISLLRANNIAHGGLDFSDLQYVSRNKVSTQQILLKDDILMCGSSGSIEHVGKAAIFNGNGEYTFGAFCKLIRANGKLKPQYISAFMNTKEYREKIAKDLGELNRKCDEKDSIACYQISLYYLYSLSLISSSINIFKYSCF